MGKLKLSALLLGAALFMSLGTTSLLAGANCESGKCASEKKAKKACDEKCTKNNPKCDDVKNCDKAKKAATMKCGAGKCGSK